MEQNRAKDLEANPESDAAVATFNVRSALKAGVPSSQEIPPDEPIKTGVAVDVTGRSRNAAGAGKSPRGFNVRSGIQAGCSGTLDEPVKTGTLSVDVTGQGRKAAGLARSARGFNVRSGIQAGAVDPPDEPVKTGSLSVDVTGQSRLGREPLKLSGKE